MSHVGYSNMHRQAVRQGKPEKKETAGVGVRRKGIEGGMYGTDSKHELQEAKKKVAQLHCFCLTGNMEAFIAVSLYWNSIFPFFPAATAKIKTSLYFTRMVTPGFFFAS